MPESEKHHRGKTKVKKQTLNPEFNENFEFCVAQCDLHKKVLNVTVWDRDVGKQDDFIGEQMCSTFIDKWFAWPVIFTPNRNSFEREGDLNNTSVKPNSNLGVGKSQW